jgi:hypothetical protein
MQSVPLTLSSAAAGLGGMARGLERTTRPVEVEPDAGSAPCAEPHSSKLARMRVDVVQRDTEFTRKFAGAAERKRCGRRRANDLDHLSGGRLGDRLDVSNSQRASRTSVMLVA